jgi:hypothetical protein
MIDLILTIGLFHNLTNQKFDFASRKSKRIGENVKHMKLKHKTEMFKWVFYQKMLTARKGITIQGITWLVLTKQQWYSAGKVKNYICLVITTSRQSRHPLAKTSCSLDSPNTLSRHTERPAKYLVCVQEIKHSFYNWTKT